jgi:hypothetical protein
MLSMFGRQTGGRWWWESSAADVGDVIPVDFSVLSELGRVLSSVNGLDLEDSRLARSSVCEGAERSEVRSISACLEGGCKAGVEYAMEQEASAVEIL